MRLHYSGAKLTASRENLPTDFFTRQTTKYALRLRPPATAAYSAIRRPRPRRQGGADPARAGSAANARTSATRAGNRAAAVRPLDMRGPAECRQPDAPPSTKAVDCSHRRLLQQTF